MNATPQDQNMVRRFQVWLGLAGMAASACGSATAVSKPSLPPPVLQGSRPVVAETPPSYSFPTDERLRLLRAALPALRSEIEQHVARAGVPGLAFGLVLDGELALSFTGGFANLETRRAVTAQTMFRAGSVTKAVTALAIRQLAERRRLSLDDALERWVPEAAALVRPSTDSRAVTLRDLLTHASGLPLNGDYDFSAAAPRPPVETDVTGSLRGARAEFTAGEGHSYSNFGYALLGIVIARAAQQPFREYVKNELLAPMGIESHWDLGDVPATQRALSYERRDERWAVVPAERLGASEADGGLILSLEGLARFAAFHLAAFPPRNDPDPGPVTRATVRDALTAHPPVVLLPGWGVEMKSAFEPRSLRLVGKAHGWLASDTCDSERSVWKDGAIDGYRALVQLLPLHGVALMTLSNGESSPRELHTAALRVLRGSGGLVARRLDPGPDLVRATRSWLLLRENWDRATFEGLHNDYFKASVDAEKQRTWSREHTRDFGTCALVGPESVLSSRHAKFDVGCERGAGQVTVRLDGYANTIAFLASSWQKAPAPELAARATALANRVLSFKDPLPPTLDSSQLASAAALREQLVPQGPCQADAVLPGKVAAAVEVRIHCQASQHKELRLTLQFDGERVARVELNRRGVQEQPCVGFE